jgi:cell division ATPase FtsA
MGFQIKTLTENDRFFVVDIGTSRIKVLLCELDSGILKILEHTSIRQSRKHMQGGNIADLQGVSESLRKSISKLESAVEGEVRDIIFSLQSPSLVTDTLSMNYVRDSEQQALTMEEIDSMVAKIEQKSLEKAKPKIISQNVEDDVQMKLVTTTLTSIVIDGKKVSNPIGFTGKNVSLTVCNIFLPIASFHVYASIARDVDKRLISFVPTPITLPKAQSESLELFDPNCFIDIGAALTTITLENFSEILGALQIPIGIGLYENMMMRKFPKLSRLEIEHIIQSHGDTPAITDEIRIGARAIRIEFLELLTNAVQV